MSMKNKADNILNWEVKQLDFKPINLELQNNKINQLKINFVDEQEPWVQFSLSEKERNILNPLNFNFKRDNINFKLKEEVIFPEENDFNLNCGFKCESISDPNSYIYNQRLTFLNAKHKVVIENEDNQDIKLGESDPWTM